MSSWCKDTLQHCTTPLSDRHLVDKDLKEGAAAKIYCGASEAVKAACTTAENTRACCRGTIAFADVGWHVHDVDGEGSNVTVSSPARRASTQVRPALPSTRSPMQMRQGVH